MRRQHKIITEGGQHWIMADVLDADTIMLEIYQRGAYAMISLDTDQITQLARFMTNVTTLQNFANAMHADGYTYDPAADTWLHSRTAYTITNADALAYWRADNHTPAPF